MASTYKPSIFMFWSMMLLFWGRISLIDLTGYVVDGVLKLFGVIDVILIGGLTVLASLDVLGIS